MLLLDMQQTDEQKPKKTKKKPTEQTKTKQLFRKSKVDKSKTKPYQNVLVLNYLGFVCMLNNIRNYVFSALHLTLLLYSRIRVKRNSLLDIFVFMLRFYQNGEEISESVLFFCHANKPIIAV